MHLLMIGLTALLSLPSLSVIAAPSTSRIIGVPNTNQYVFEDTENAADATGDITVYYLPTRSVIDTRDGRSLWSFSVAPNQVSEASFRIRLVADETAQANFDSLKSYLSGLYHVAPTQVKIYPLALENTKIEVFQDDDIFLRKDVPAPGFPALGSLSFSFRLKASGTKWLRDQIVRQGLQFGVVRATSVLKNELTGAERVQTHSIPLYIDGVPFCAVTSAGCPQ